MASRTRGLTLDVDDPVQLLSGADVREALEKKRKSLDQEIAQFKASKEEEYRIYERELRSRKKGHSDKKKSAIGNRGSDHDTSLTDFPKTAIHKLEAAKQANLFSNFQKGSLSGVDAGMLDKLRINDQPRDREVEFRGLFTPTYLPFLENSPQTPKRHSKETPSSTFLRVTGSSLEGDKQENQLSSSATLPAIAFDPLRSPPQTAPYSASVPRPNALKERRSSSRSDISITSLRSSLRQPKTPRSPKHVLFSIDNIVLSPSTSPVARRKHAAPPIPFSGLESMPSMTSRTFIIDHGHEDRPLDVEHDSSGTVEQIEDVAIPSRSANFGSARSTHANSSPYSTSTAYHRFIGPNQVSSRIGGDDFEYIGRDDDALFPFDEEEDIDMQELGRTTNGLETSAFDDDDSKDDAMFEGSPHAGSLPIEIKWPARIDPRK